MAAYDTLRAAIDSYIKANGNKEITGTVLNDILNAMVSALGADTRFAGVAVPSTNPGNPEGNVVYFASQAGTYSNFGGIVLPLGIHILVWNGTAWTSQTWFSVNNTPTQNSQNLVTSGGIFQAIVDAVGVERLRAIGAEVTSCSFNSTTKKVSFFNSANSTLFQLDATAFIIDGMVRDVKIEDGNLVIQFNTDAGKQDIEIPLTEIFDPANYYTKTAIDTLLTAINNKLADGCLYRGMAEPTTNPPTPTTKVFYIATKAGTYTNFGNIAVTEGITILKYDGSNWSKEQISYCDGVFDISAYNGTSYADLSSALGTNGANIPQNLRKGGMSVKFVQSSDNKYVQYRCMAQNFTTDVTQWQGVDDEPVDGSENFVKSGGVTNYIDYNIIENQLIKRNYQVNGGTGKWEAGKHIILPVLEGFVVNVNSQKLYYVLLSDYAKPVIGDTPSYVNGYEGRKFTNSTVTIPSGCKYIAFNATNITFGNITINGYIANRGAFNYINALIYDLNHKDTILSQNGTKLITSGNIYSSVSSMLAELTQKVMPYQINGGTGKWENGNHIVLPVVKGIEIVVNNSASNNIYYGLLSDYTIPVVGQTPSYVPGYEGRKFAIDKITIPEGCKYVIITSTGNLLPSSIKINNIEALNGLGEYIFALSEHTKTIATSLSELSNKAVTDNNLTTVVVSKNIANPDNIITDGAVNNVGSKPVAGSWSGWDSVMIPVSAGQIISFGGVYLGRSGYGAFYNGNTLVSMISFADPNGSYTADTINITVPSGATELYIDIKTTSSPANPYDNLMVNYGSALLPYEPFEERISKINNISLIGGSDTDAVDIIADLPVSDGTGISVGYAYIDSSTGNVKVKLS